MITRPLELESRLSPPPRDLDFVAWVNVGTIVLFFSLLGSQFVLPPGEPVDVGGNGTMVLPSTNVSSLGTGAVSVVVTYRRDDVILFEGGMYTLPALRKQMENYIKKHPGAVMLARMDKQVSMQAFLNLCSTAREVGFANILIAAEPEGPANLPK